LLSLDQDLPDKLKDAIGETMIKSGVQAGMIFSLVKVYNSLNVELNFNSTEQLPE